MFCGNDFSIDTVQAVGVHATFDVAHVLQRVAEIVDAALAEHDVVVEVLAESFPQLHRLFVQQRRFGPQVVRANDGGVASCITAANPALLEDGDVAHVVFTRQVICCGKTVTAAANDDDIVFLLRFRTAPGFLPVPVMTESIADEVER